jgi:hypothetical protein
LQLAVLALQLRHQALALGEQIIMFDRLPQHGLQFLRLPRLADITVDIALVDGVDNRLDVGIGGKQEANRVGILLAQALEKLDAGHLGHALVRHHDVDRLALHDLEPLGRARGAEDAIIEAEQILNAVDQIGLIVHDQEAMLELAFHDAARPPISPHSCPADPGLP